MLLAFLTKIVRLVRLRPGASLQYSTYSTPRSQQPGVYAQGAAGSFQQAPSKWFLSQPLPSQASPVDPAWKDFLALQVNALTAISNSFGPRLDDDHVHEPRNVINNVRYTIDLPILKDSDPEVQDHIDLRGPVRAGEQRQRSQCTRENQFHEKLP